MSQAARRVFGVSRLRGIDDEDKVSGPVEGCIVTYINGALWIFWRCLEGSGMLRGQSQGVTVVKACVPRIPVLRFWGWIRK